MTNKLVASMLSALFPDQCTGCEGPLFAEDSQRIAAVDRFTIPLQANLAANQRRWCAGCWAELGLVGRLQCEFCAAEIRAVNPLGEGCPLCLSADLRFDQAVCLGNYTCLLYTSPSPRDLSTSRMPSSA